MNTSQNETKKVKVEVLEAELVDPNEEREDGVGAVPMRAAEALDAFADVVGAFVPARAEDLRRKATAVRSFAKATERAADAGEGLVASVKRAAKKLEEKGLGVSFVGNRRAHVRSR